MGKFDKDSLGARMKTYEAVTNHVLVPRMPMIIRLDGSSFHTFTKGLKKPFDIVFLSVMRKTMLELCKEVATCKFGYTQSDEITLVCKIDNIQKTDGYMHYEINKILSKTSAMCTLFFNKYWRQTIGDIENNAKSSETFLKDYRVDIDVYKTKYDKAFFDCRVFNVPDWEVMNNLIWRQQDCVRNSISSLAQAHFTQKELHCKSSVNMQDMLMSIGINWNDLESAYKRGAGCYKAEKGWYLDLELPIFTEEEGRKLISDTIFHEEVV